MFSLRHFQESSASQTSATPYLAAFQYRYNHRYRLEDTIEALDDTHDSVFIVFGSDITLPEGERGTGRSVSRVTDPALRNMFRDACAESVSGGVAIYLDGMIRTASDTKAGYRCNFMPVRSGYENANMYVFGAFGITAEPVSERNVT